VIHLAVVVDTFISKLFGVFTPLNGGLPYMGINISFADHPYGSFLLHTI